MSSKRTSDGAKPAGHGCHCNCNRCSAYERAQQLQCDKPGAIAQHSICFRNDRYGQVQEIAAQRGITVSQLIDGEIVRAWLESVDKNG